MLAHSGVGECGERVGDEERSARQGSPAVPVLTIRYLLRGGHAPRVFSDEDSGAHGVKRLIQARAV